MVERDSLRETDLKRLIWKDWSGENSLTRFIERYCLARPENRSRVGLSRLDSVASKELRESSTQETKISSR
jgi:hypothetical protein